MVDQNVNTFVKVAFNVATDLQKQPPVVMIVKP